jgi:hypothetical protein
MQRIHSYGNLKLRNDNDKSHAYKILICAQGFRNLNCIGMHLIVIVYSFLSIFNEGLSSAKQMVD